MLAKRNRIQKIFQQQFLKNRTSDLAEILELSLYFFRLLLGMTLSFHDFVLSSFWEPLSSPLSMSPLGILDMGFYCKMY